ncbi:uncharacterized protein J3R85_006473 [Psidium guajava]|nr:uncharacterized protein J3R85_006473 [Psidium guajava]
MSTSDPSRSIGHYGAPVCFRSRWEMTGEPHCPRPHIGKLRTSIYYLRGRTPSRASAACVLRDVLQGEW